MIVYLINRMTSTNLNHISSFEKLFHCVPNYNLLNSFGCLCFSWWKPYTHSKFQTWTKSLPCCFIRYYIKTKGFWCLELSVDKVYTSCHATFTKHTSSFSEKSFTQSTSFFVMWLFLSKFIIPLPLDRVSSCYLHFSFLYKSYYCWLVQPFNYSISYSFFIIL